MPQDFFYISLDIFRGILHNKGITDDLNAWLTFLRQEEPALPYDDGARTLFLYTKGTRGRSRKKLRELLCYMENSTDDNAVNPELKKIHHMVEKVEPDR